MGGEGGSYVYTTVQSAQLSIPFLLTPPSLGTKRARWVLAKAEMLAGCRREGAVVYVFCFGVFGFHDLVDRFS